MFQSILFVPLRSKKRKLQKHPNFYGPQKECKKATPGQKWAFHQALVSEKKRTKNQLFLWGTCSFWCFWGGGTGPGRRIPQERIPVWKILPRLEAQFGWSCLPCIAATLPMGRSERHSHGVTACVSRPAGGCASACDKSLGAIGTGEDGVEAGSDGENGECEGGKRDRILVHDDCTLWFCMFFFNTSSMVHLPCHIFVLQRALSLWVISPKRSQFYS